MPGVLNHPSGGWAFQSLAERLSAALWVDIVSEPTGFDYVLWPGDGVEIPADGTFISPHGVACAADKRLQVTAFRRHGVQTPLTHLCETTDEVAVLLTGVGERRWILKYPTACGGVGHRFITSITDIPATWPTPYIVQEFVALERPEVYRIYGAAGELFGFNARRFPRGSASCSPWVAHARGARYEHGEVPPPEAVQQAAKALTAAGLFDSFGAVDLMRDAHGRWLVLEVGTDGIANHVDRDVDLGSLSDDIDRRLAIAFWRRLGTPPWGTGGWRRHNAALTG
jgi:glutathione synthase/RimK-type ligase-like ATP-grasp enzyme